MQKKNLLMYKQQTVTSQKMCYFSVSCSKKNSNHILSHSGKIFTPIPTEFEVQKPLSKVEEE